MLQIEIECQRADVEALSALLDESNCLSQVLTDKYDDAILEPELGTTPLWPDVIVHALFSETDEAEQAVQQIKAQFPKLNPILSILPDKDWERVCLDEFKPLQFGTSLWVTPSWLEPPEANAVNLVLDPGLAFGTGTHATTALCLKWLEECNLQDKELIDYGCGSGIIALAGLKLGAHHAYAVDIDEQAILATRQNADNNDISKVRLTTGFPDILDKKVDIVIANILLSPLLTLKTSFLNLIKKEGVLVVSGILAEQADTLIKAYGDHFKHHETQQQEDWVLLVFKPLPA